MIISYGLLYLIFLCSSYALIVISSSSFTVSHLRASFGSSYGNSSRDETYKSHIDISAMIAIVRKSEGCEDVITNVSNRIALLERVIPEPECSIAKQVYNVTNETVSNLDE